MTSKGIRVVEFNVRFGDPETQAVLARLRTPLGQLLRAAARGEISEGTELDWDPRTAVDVVMAAENYPDTPRKGDVISGLDEANAPGGRARDSRGYCRIRGGCADCWRSCAGCCCSRR